MVEKDPNPEAETKKSEIIKKLGALFSQGEPELVVMKKGLLGARVEQGGWVIYSRGYDQPTFEERVEVRRGIGGRFISRTHTLHVDVNAGEDVEGARPKQTTYFAIDVDSGKLSVGQSRGVDFVAGSNYPLEAINTATELEQLQALDSLIPQID